MIEPSNAKPLGSVMTKVIDAAVSQGPSTKDSQTSEAAHKRKFLETFRRWEILFKRKDSGDVQAEKWLIAEYYDSLKHLSAEGFDVLTRELKEHCVFFPSIKECLDLTRPSGRYDWGHPFVRRELFQSRQPTYALAAPVAQLEDGRD